MFLITTLYTKHICNVAFDNVISKAVLSKVFISIVVVSKFDGRWRPKCYTDFFSATVVLNDVSFPLRHCVATL